MNLRRFFLNGEVEKKTRKETEYMYQYYEDDFNSMPVITLEVLSDSSNQEQASINLDDDFNIELNQTDLMPQDTGVIFSTDTSAQEQKSDSNENKDQEHKDSTKPRNEFLEYMTRNDGSVICKLCGEILQSRTHWYRHKYKLHVQPLNPAPLFQCEQCLVYFKSRKGYIGHIASRHSEVLNDSSPVLTNSQAEALAKELAAPQQIEAMEEADPELSIPKSSVPNYQTKQNSARSETKRTYRSSRGDSNKTVSESMRSKEEKLVADIIDRVRRECEAQESGGARRGYTRRTTVMHT